MNLYAYLDGATNIQEQSNRLRLDKHVNIPDMESAYNLAGLQFRRVLVDIRIPDDVRQYLRTLNKWIPSEE